MLSKKKLWGRLCIPLVAFTFIGCTNEDIEKQENEY